MRGEEEEGFSLILWQLQQYQMVIRKWQPHFTSNEFAIVMQILDRTIGWQKNVATFRSSKLLEGDRMYGGLGAAMVRSTMMKALRVLEDRGVIARRQDEDRPWLREYSINLDWTPDTLWGTRDFCVSIDGVSDEDSAVRLPDLSISNSADGVSVGDPRERYQENPIGEPYLDNSRPARPSPPALDARLPEFRRSQEEERSRTFLPDDQNPFRSNFSDINPRPRKRRVAS